LINGATSLEQLVGLEQRHGSAFDAIHIATSFKRSANLARDLGQPPSDFYPLMQRLWGRLQPQLGDCNMRELANIVWACSKVSFAEAPLLDECLEQLAGAGADANPLDLSNALYAAALLSRSKYTMNKQHAQQLVEALVSQRQAAKPQDVSNTLWVAATMGLSLPEQQGRQLVEALVRQRQAAKPQELTNTLWAAANMGLSLPYQHAQLLMDALVQQRPGPSGSLPARRAWPAPPPVRRRTRR
jgi:hypothetical protein